jgi:transglutaminase-like putative cysteine protease
MRLSIRHETRYAYGGAVDYAVQRLYLAPSDTDSQKVVSWSIDAAGAENALSYRDGFGNIVHLVTAHLRQDHAVISATGVVDVTDAAGMVSGVHCPAPDVVFLRQTRQTMPNAALKKLAQDAAAADPTALGKMHALMNAVYGRIGYEVGATTADTTAAEALALGRGVCQDHTHIFLSAARQLGIPARYVTGYLATGIGQSATASHAWAETLIPDLGWVAFDATNNICPQDQHVRVAAGLDAAGVTPIRGSRRGGLAESMTVAVTVEAGEQ